MMTKSNSGERSIGKDDGKGGVIADNTTNYYLGNTTSYEESVTTVVYKFLIVPNTIDP